MTEHTTPDHADVPSVSFERMLLVGTGAIGVTFLPFWLNWLRMSYPRLEVQVVVTRSAQRFVTVDALTAVSGKTVMVDAWPDEPQPGARHVELAQWSDAIIVYPASLHYLARFALGLADTPTLLALQCTRVPVGLAPALPPGAETGPGVERHLARIEHHDNVVVAPPRPGPSASTGNNDAAVAAPLPTLLLLLEQVKEVSTSPFGGV